MQIPLTLAGTAEQSDQLGHPVCLSNLTARSLYQGKSCLLLAGYLLLVRGMQIPLTLAGTAEQSDQLGHPVCLSNLTARSLYQGKSCLLLAGYLLLVRGMQIPLTLAGTAEQSDQLGHPVCLSNLTARSLYQGKSCLLLAGYLLLVRDICCSQNKVISSATQCALATSHLVACTKVRVGKSFRSWCSTTGAPKAMVCAILFVGWCISKNPCC